MNMDIVRIKPSRLEGEVKVPPSKSAAHRALISAFLSGKEGTVRGIMPSDDMRATLGCVEALGGVCEFDEKNETVVFRKPRPHKGKVRMDCGESGSTLRFFIPIALALAEGAEFEGHGRLMQRPLEPYFKIFREMGISYRKTENVLTVDGKLKAGRFAIDGGLSSQFITGLLFALPLLDGKSEILIEGKLESRGYVDMTLSILEKFGIKVKNENYSKLTVLGNQSYTQQNYTVEGDYSQAAFFLAAGALGCDINCRGLDFDSLQGDKRIVELIEEAGGKIERLDDGFRAVRTDNMHGITVDASEIPDLVPILAVMLAFCRGESKIVNAGRLRIKESDRLRAISSELSRLGADIYEGSDYLKIVGKQVLSGNTVSAWGDHRIAMALAIAACRCEGCVEIHGAAEAVKKSYPSFFDDYAALGGILK